MGSCKGIGPSFGSSKNLKKIEMKCHSCEILYINGFRCHETGCPDAWKDYIRECKWCGSKFKPENKFQHFCCEDCAEYYCS